MGDIIYSISFLLGGDTHTVTGTKSACQAVARLLEEITEYRVVPGGLNLHWYSLPTPCTPPDLVLKTWKKTALNHNQPYIVPWELLNACDIENDGKALSDEMT